MCHNHDCSVENAMEPFLIVLSEILSMPTDRTNVPSVDDFEWTSPQGTAGLTVSNGSVKVVQVPWTDKAGRVYIPPTTVNLLPSLPTDDTLVLFAKTMRTVAGHVGWRVLNGTAE